MGNTIIKSGKVRSGKTNRFYIGNFEYHICLQIDPNIPDVFDDEIHLFSVDDKSYYQIINVMDTERTERIEENGVSFINFKFTGVKTGKRYDCLLYFQPKTENTPNENGACITLLKNFLIDADEE